VELKVGTRYNTKIPKSLLYLNLVELKGIIRKSKKEIKEKVISEPSGIERH